MTTPVEQLDTVIYPEEQLDAALPEKVVTGAYRGEAYNTDEDVILHARKNPISTPKVKTIETQTANIKSYATVGKGGSITYKWHQNLEDFASKLEQTDLN